MEAKKVDEWWQYIEKHPDFTGCLINSNNDIVWFKNGKEHREDGPAFECLSGYKAWFKNGLWHREDGPAREWPNGDKAWYLSGVRYNSEQEWIIATRKIKLERVLKNIH